MSVCLFVCNGQLWRPEESTDFDETWRVGSYQDLVVCFWAPLLWMPPLPSNGTLKILNTTRILRIVFRVNVNCQARNRGLGNEKQITQTLISDYRISAKGDWVYFLYMWKTRKWFFWWGKVFGKGRISTFLRISHILAIPERVPDTLVVRETGYIKEEGQEEYESN